MPYGIARHNTGVTKNPFVPQWPWADPTPRREQETNKSGTTWSDRQRCQPFQLSSRSIGKLRDTLTDTIINAKLRKNLTFEQLAEGTGPSVVYVTAALLGQHPLPAKAAKVVGQKLDLNSGEIELLKTIPLRGSIPGGVPTDPTVYRFYEMVQVYGSTLRALIHEQFGDGIVSAINFKLNITKVVDPEGGHRAVITLDGKFLPFKPF
ncbi:Cyanate hydratase [Hypsibius exemplaris]|uniref:Cyanate hydratase n=1 Tax=Hypsibius exemplaris TaxID=2072580 RepID=A0A1W0X7W5_HYPEX|nr:Cyanate hydratase [Hypsibius exemplaris]